MVFTKAELIGSLQHEVNILLHLAGKVDSRSLDYRPTAKQRSTIEWLRYMTIMGPEMIKATKAGAFDGAAWGAAEKASSALTLDEVKAALMKQREVIAQELGAMSDADFRVEIDMFGQKYTRGSFLVNLVLCGYAAYRAQIFLYLKTCGREELNTMNLWAGVDGPM
jgi:hypothetical protein